MAKKNKNKDEQVEQELNQEELVEGQADVSSSQNDEIEQLNLKLKEQEDKYLRLYAEYDNFRRRSAKEKLDLIQNASEGIILSLLPVLDDFDRSLKASQENVDGLKEGVELVYRKFNSILEGKGLKKMDSANKEFDHDLQEAVTQIPVEDKKMQGKVVDVLEEGYMLNDKVIRFAKVVIGA